MSLFPLLHTLQVNCFRAILSTTPEDLLPAVYLCTNRVAPAHMGVELGVGESILIKVWGDGSVGMWVVVDGKRLSLSSFPE